MEEIMEKKLVFNWKTWKGDTLAYQAYLDGVFDAIRILGWEIGEVVHTQRGSKPKIINIITITYRLKRRKDSLDER